MSVSNPPAFVSLLKWLNTFDLDQPPCEKVEDLCSGHVILSCLSTVLPEAPCSDKDPWIIIMKTLEDYCGCSLDSALSLEKAKSGDIEHMARVVVLLLCFLVESESINRNVIEQIMELPLEVQQHLMALIKSGLDKVNSDTLSTGKFESGVGVGACAPSSLYESQGSVTPMRPPRQRTRSIVYRGLESPACQRWLKSPAFSRMKTVPKTSLLVSIMNSSRKPRIESDDKSEEVRQLEHQLSILKRKIESEKQLNADLATELDSMAQTCTSLQEANSQLHLKVQSRDEKNKDLVDELVFKESRLKEAESAVAKYKSEAESLSSVKDKCRELEGEMGNYESMKTQLQEQTTKLHILELDKVERDMELKRLTIALERKLLELQLAQESKERSHRSLLELSKKRDDVLQRLKHLDREKSELEAVCRQKTERLEELGGRLAATVGQVEHLTMDITQLKAKMDTADKEHKLYQLQMTEKLLATETSNMELQTKLGAAMEERDSHRTEVESLQRASADLQAQLDSGCERQESLKQQIVALERINSGLQTKLNTASEIQGSLRQEAEMLKQRNLELQSTLGGEQEAHQSCQLQVQALQKTNSDLQVTLSAACEEHEQFERKTNDEIHSLEEAKVDLQNKLDEALEVHQSYKLEMTEQVESLQKANGSLQAMLDSTREEHITQQERLQGEMQALLLNNADLQAKVWAALEESKAYKTEMTCEIESLQELRADLQAKLSVACGERDSLRQQVQELETKEKEAQVLKKHFSDLQARLEREQVSWKLQQQEFERTIADLRARLDTTAEDRDSWKQRSQVQENNYSDVRVKLEGKQGSWRLRQLEFESTIADLTAQLGTATKKRDLWEQQAHALVTSNAGLQATLNTASEEVSSYKQQVQALERNCQEVVDTANREKELYEQRVQGLERSNGNLIEQVNAGHKELESWRQQAHTLEKDCSELQAKLERAIESFELQANDRVEALESTCVSLQAKLDNVCRKCESYKTKMNDEVNSLRKAGADLHARLTVAYEEHEAFKTQAELDFQAKMEAMCNQHSTKVSALERGKADLQTELQSVQNELATYSRKLRFKEADNAQLMHQVMYLERELKETKVSQESQRPVSRISNITNTVSCSGNASLTDSVRDVSVDYSGGIGGYPNSVGSVETEGSENRVSELQRRNKMNLPHLKSSYPVEMQVKPESPSVSNETIKNGSGRGSKHSPIETRKSTAFTMSLGSPESSSRKRSREFDKSVSSPPTSNRRISALPTPDSMTTRTRAQRQAAADRELRQSTLASSKGLGPRDFLDEPAPTTLISSTSFDVNFSPPRVGRGRVPKRFRGLGTVNRTVAVRGRADGTLPSEQQRRTVTKRPTRSKK